MALGLFVRRRRRILTSLLPFAASAAMSSSAGSASASASDGSCHSLFSDPALRIGLGTYLLERPRVREAIRAALAVGYRRIDTAAVYFNEDAVGDALQEALADGLLRDRAELFLVGKLPSAMHRDAERALRKTLADLRTDYLDLYLVHWPVAFRYDAGLVPLDRRGYENENLDDSGNGSKIDPTVSIHDTWASMQELVHKGLVRHIGVSNFPVMLLHELLSKHGEPLPVVNQCEAHPYLQNSKLLAYCNHRSVHFQAYSPLGGTPNADEPVELLRDPVLGALGAKHGATPAQVCLAWALRRGTSVVVKGSSRAHLEENWRAAALALDAEDLRQLAQLERHYRFFRPDEWWPEAAMAVFD